MKVCVFVVLLDVVVNILIVWLRVVFVLRLFVIEMMLVFGLMENSLFVLLFRLYVIVVLFEIGVKV